MTHSADDITTAEVRLAAYGSLAPGQPNHYQLAGLRGTWTLGTVRGRLHDAGWGAGMGYPALVLDPTGPAVSVQVLTSADLPDHWERLDVFEGAGYRRVAVTVLTRAGAVGASIYVLA